jgi:small GTP-binding protein
MTPVLKVVMLGAAATGKTSLLVRLRLGSHQPDGQLLPPTSTTIGGECHSFSGELLLRPSWFPAFKGSSPPPCLVWDTAGQEMYESLSDLYSRGCHGAVIVVDGSATSVDRLLFWLHHHTVSNVPVAVVLNKTDLAEKLYPPDVTNSRCYRAAAAAVARRNKSKPGSVRIFFASALTGDGVIAPFEWVYSLAIPRSDLCPARVTQRLPTCLSPQFLEAFPQPLSPGLISPETSSQSSSPRPFEPVSPAVSPVVSLDPARNSTFHRRSDSWSTFCCGWLVYCFPSQTGASPGVKVGFHRLERSLHSGRRNERRAT